MRSNAGVWIDHRKAVIVRITDDGEEIRSIESGMEKHVRHSGQGPEDQQDHRFTNHLNEYYSKVIVALQDADSILLFGPGEAKGELEKRFPAEPDGGRIVALETADKMSYHQMAAKTREYFQHQVETVQQVKDH